MGKEIENDNTTQSKSLSRRDFLFRLPITGAIASSFFSDLYEIVNIDLNLTENKERFLATDPLGNRLGLVLGNHGSRGEDNGSSTTIKESDLYLPMGALFLDSPVHFASTVTVEMVFNEINAAIKRNPNFYQTPFNYVRGNNLPIIFGDIDLLGMSSGEFAEKFGKPEITSLVLALVASTAGKTGEALAENIQFFSERQTTTRDFLKIVTAGLATGALYYATPALTYVARSFGIRYDSARARDLQAFFSDLIHPDNAVVVMRNIIWAEKCRDLQERGIIDRGKIVNILGGAGHRFCDYFFRNPNAGKKYWDTYGYRKIVNDLSSGNPEWVYKSLVYMPKDNSLKFIEHPGMRRFS